MHETTYSISTEQMRAFRVRFGVTCFGVFAVLSSVLFFFDVVPQSKAVQADVPQATVSTVLEVPESLTTVSVTEDPVPVRISIRAIGVDTPIVTPASADIAVLDRALLSGAVHYPGSVRAGEQGNMLLFGHSSYLPVVKNKSFQAFNELSKLTAGDMVDVFSETHQYTYQVDTVRLTRAEDAIVPLAADRSELTLATCNTFGAKQERWVVTAHLISKVPL